MISKIMATNSCRTAVVDIFNGWQNLQLQK